MQLTHPKPMARIGMKRDGTDEIRAHPFFSGFVWKKLVAKTYKAPWYPKVKSPTDVGNFPDEYDDHQDVRPYTKNTDWLKGW